MSGESENPGCTGTGTGMTLVRRYGSGSVQVREVGPSSSEGPGFRGRGAALRGQATAAGASLSSAVSAAATAGC